MAPARQGNRRRGGRSNNLKRFKKNSNRVNGNNSDNVGFNARAALIGINAMFNASQIPDNPGYVDFNEPPTPLMPPVPQKMKLLGKGRVNRRLDNQKSGKWPRGNIRRHITPLTPPPAPLITPDRLRSYVPIPRLGRNGGRLIPPPPPINIRSVMPLIPPMTSGRFVPRSLMPPPPPIGGMPMAPLPPLLPQRGPPMRRGPVLSRPLVQRGGPPGPIHRNKNIQSNRKSSGKNNRKRQRSGAAQKRKNVTKKTLIEIINQYPLDKPWVTDEIKDEYKKKEEIENKLKGNKDDKLFAEFKLQRDKFVNLYEAAKLEYIGKHPEQDIEKIMTESDKAKAENQIINNDNQKQQINVINNTNVNASKTTDAINGDNNKVEKPKQQVVNNKTAAAKAKYNAAVRNNVKAVKPAAIPPKPRVTRARGKNFI